MDHTLQHLEHTHRSQPSETSREPQRLNCSSGLNLTANRNLTKAKGVTTHIAQFSAPQSDSEIGGLKLKNINVHLLLSHCHP